MYLIVKLRFGFLFRYSPQHKASRSLRRFPKQSVCSFGQNPQALAWTWKWRQNFTLKTNIPTVNALGSTNRVFICKITIEDYFNNHSELTGSKFLPLAPIKSVAFFQGPLGTTSSPTFL